MNIRQNISPSYWLNVEPVKGKPGRPTEGGILIVGTGLTGVSAAYWLLENGFDKITLVDFAFDVAATNRNCGHILYGTVESMKAMVALHGKELAREVWQHSIQICHEVRDTVAKLGLDVDYKQDGYLVVAIDETEDKEVKESVELLNEMGFQSDYWSKEKVENHGFRETFGARFERGSAQAHPVKFRNELLKHVLGRGCEYFSDVQVTAVEGEGEHAIAETAFGDLRYDAVVIAANAYNPLLSRFFKERKLVEPFRGQIITSQPLQHRFSVKHPHSFDHGYEYAIVTEDNRLMLGGWRNHTDGETGTYDLCPNPFVEKGLKDFAKRHYAIEEDLRWEYSWSGIMAASKTGFPFIGPTTHPQVFTCSGYTGHGFSWAHGSAKLLADIIVGNRLPPVARLFQPVTL